MKRLITMALLLLCTASLWSQTEKSFPTQNATGKIYLGTDSDLSFSFSDGDRFVSGRVGVVAQYFVSENLALGLDLGVGGNRSYFDNDIFISRNNTLRLSSYLEATYYPVWGRTSAVQAFVRTALGLSRGRSQVVPELGDPRNSPIGTISLGFSPGLTIALPNDALLNISTTLLRLGLSRQGKGVTTIRDPFVSGGLNSSINIAYIKEL
ncbi:MAG: hypothetical protein AB8H47_19155 [Bacteroidia bacterium]